MLVSTCVFTSGSQTVTGRGCRQRWPGLSEARQARGRAVVGAVAFDPGDPDVLWEPDVLEFRDCGMTGPAGTLTRTAAQVTSITAHPSRAAHRSRIEEVLGRIRRGEADKVVLGRAETLMWSQPVDPWEALESFVHSDPQGSGYLVDLGHGYLVGSSPEVLIARSGRTIRAFPLAGTAPRETSDSATVDPDIDDAGRALLHSSKDHAEHAFVTRALEHALRPLCENLSIPATPSLVATPTTWHLGTPITGTLREPVGCEQLPTVLDLVACVHPTPAVCGTPTDQALSIIREEEGQGQRGLFGGAVGWSDRAGDGEFRITIRGAILAADGLSATVWAGGGLTVDSDPEAELHETTVKLERARRVFGVGAVVS